ncbi:MAG: hypothetical protein M3Q07_26545 [Pseudobdellovibrionaceae bacterium]|nr:hypothetical protein [Pseudobdellovibrionaceae bacterium]
METLVDLIHKKLRELIDSRYGGNISKAAHVMKADYHLVYKGYHGTLKGLAFFQAYDILKHLAPGDFKPILGEYYPENMRSLLDIAGTDDEDPMEVLNRKMGALLANQISYAIYVMAEHSKDKLTKHKVRQAFGAFGLQELDRLITSEVLTFNGEGEINTTIRGQLSPEGDFPRVAVERQIASLSLANSGTSIHTQHGLLNEKGIKEAFTVASEAAGKMEKVFSDETNRGDILFFGTSFCGPFDLGKGDIE